MKHPRPHPLVIKHAWKIPVPYLETNDVREPNLHGVTSDFYAVFDDTKYMDIPEESTRIHELTHGTCLPDGTSI